MAAHYPTGEQKKVIWTAATGLAWAIIGGLIVLAGWLLTSFLGLIYPVLLPLGVAAIAAYILDPVVDWLGTRKVRRSTAVAFLLALIVAVFLTVGALLIPIAFQQSIKLIDSMPTWLFHLRETAQHYLSSHDEVANWVDRNLAGLGERIPAWVASNADNIWQPFHQIFTWLGFALGFLFVPLYVYYFLIEKQSIQTQWKEYVPLHRSRWRGEVVQVLADINHYLILFFRGQVLVGACIGVLTTIGLLLIGLPYALLIGIIAGTLSIIPYLGVVSSLVPALMIAWFQFDGFLMPALVIAVFSIVQLAEGFFISPRIMGNRTGLHPLTVIISILTWSLLLPGLLGPILAVPLTATLRVLMYRYVWLKVSEPAPPVHE